MAKEKKTPHDKIVEEVINANRPRLSGHMVVTGNSIDSVSNTHNITLSASLKGQKMKIAFKGLDEEQHDEILKSLGIDTFTEHTPLRLEIFVPDASLLEDWKEFTKVTEVVKVSEDQTTLGSEKDASDQ